MMEPTITVDPNVNAMKFVIRMGVNAGENLRSIKQRESTQVYLQALETLGMHEVQAAYMIKLTNRYDQLIQSGLSPQQCIDLFFNDQVHADLGNFILN